MSELSDEGFENLGRQVKDALEADDGRQRHQEARFVEHFARKGQRGGLSLGLALGFAGCVALSAWAIFWVAETDAGLGSLLAARSSAGPAFEGEMDQGAERIPLEASQNLTLGTWFEGRTEKNGNILKYSSVDGDKVEFVLLDGGLWVDVAAVADGSASHECTVEAGPYMLTISDGSARLLWNPWESGLDVEVLRGTVELSDRGSAMSVTLSDGDRRQFEAVDSWSP